MVQRQDHEQTEVVPSDAVGQKNVGSLGQCASQRRAGWGAATAVLGTAFLLVLGYMLLSAEPSPASVSTRDIGADHSTGPTDPNGPR
jgi:hypothetical protein